MSPYQRQELLNGLARNRIDHKLANGGEITILCPLCSHLHENRRRTLCLNTSNDRWHCFRCSEFKGRKKQIPRMLRELGLESLVSVFEADEVLIEDDSLDKVKRKLLFGDQHEAVEQQPLTLPEGYRTDWDATLVGRNLYRYLTQKRKLGEEAILKYRLGYAVVGTYAGGVVLPVYMNRVLRFWQVRYVVFANKDKYDSPKGINKREVLFNLESVEPENVVVVEGIFDVLSTGDSCVALLGKAISDEQIALLQAKKVETVTVMLDGGAWKDCKQVAYEIRKKLWGVRLVTAVRLPFDADPGDLGRAALVKPLETLRLRG